MKKYFSKNQKKLPKHFNDDKAKGIVRMQNLATRMDLGHVRGERKKKKSK